ncbi:hypothetical protein AN963_23220 [Brevibacillus choshinensis]|uniref:Uncharacterized protein n=1 Tax=Brevibacillus choshinensis TaxID=54911 RepID=A0ABR5N1D7_BRECH|nr:hypothetical protein [Brevibacillus choshinensis]KQL44319.1 hypothetical protein AN963_23220 [Brevibacillus choshinensis]
MLVGCNYWAVENNRNQNTIQTIPRYSGEKSKVIPFVYTAKKELTFTFNGMGDEATMTRLRA